MRVTLFLLILLAAVPSARADFATGLEAYERGDYAGAIVIWRPLAQEGMVEAQFNLGLMHDEGKGLPADSAAAHAWFLRAAESGYARAQYRVADMFEKGIGTKQNLVLAHLWFTSAKRQKFLDARKRRSKVAKEMTTMEIAEAEMLARQRKRASKAAN